MPRSARLGTAGALVAALVATAGPAALTASEVNAAYFIIEVDVRDPDTFNSYAEKATDMVQRYGGTFVVMGGRVRSVEGAPPNGNVVVIRFDDYDRAELWLASEEYAQIKPLRHSSAETRQILAEAVPENP